MTMLYATYSQMPYSMEKEKEKARANEAKC